MWRLIWGNDHLYCGFGARRSHLTLHWMSAQGSVGFRWGTTTGPYHANFSQVETQKFDPHWFYCLQWGCNNLFCQECTFQRVDRTWLVLQLKDAVMVMAQLYWFNYNVMSRNAFIKSHDSICMTVSRNGLGIINARYYNWITQVKITLGYVIGLNEINVMLFRLLVYITDTFDS